MRPLNTSLKLKQARAQWSVVLRRKVDGKPVRLNVAPLNKRDDAEAILALLNEYHLTGHINDTLPESIRARLSGEVDFKVKVGGKAKAVPSDVTAFLNECQLVLGDERYNRLVQYVEAPLRRANGEYLSIIEKQKREIEHWAGKKLNRGPLPTLGEAADKFIKAFSETKHGETVASDINRFAEHFGRGKNLAWFEGREAELDDWIKNLKDNRKGKGGVLLYPEKPLGASRRNKVRMYALKLLSRYDVDIRRDRVCKISAKAIKRERGAIRWLEEHQARALHENIRQEKWRDAFRFQLCTGLRPSELVTLKRSDFNEDLSLLTLSARDKFSLKTGSRTIRVPLEAREIIERRAAINEDIIFPPRRKKAADWKRLNGFHLCYRRIIQKAAAAAGIKMKVDARIARRTCASILLRAGHSYAEVAALLGDEPDTIKEHYAAILSQEVDTAPAARIFGKVLPIPVAKAV